MSQYSDELREAFMAVERYREIWRLWSDFISDFREAFRTGDASKLEKWCKHE